MNFGTVMAAVNINDLDLLFEVKFTSEFWISDIRFSKIEPLIQILETGSQNNLINSYLNQHSPSQKEQSWYCYLKALTISDMFETLDMMQKSAELGNSYAMIYYADRKGNPEKNYLKIAADLGHPEAIVKYIMCYFHTDEILYDDLKIEDSVALELEKMVLSDLQKLPKLKNPELDQIYCLLRNIYEALDIISGDDYLDEIMYYKSWAVGAFGYNVNEYAETSRQIARRNYDKKLENQQLKKENEELKKAYDELKKLKELDFNNLISNGVGEYLADS